MTNLSDLPYVLLTEIARRLKKLEDYVSFRSVSKSLRAAAKEDYFEGLRLRNHTPYMMLSVRDDNDDIREIYSLVENESIVASVKFPNFKRKKCLESLGWLLVSDIDGSCCLLDPFSGTEIPLPHQSTFPEYDLYEMEGPVFFEKMVLSSKPNETSDFVLMVIGGCIRELAFWRLGDEAWTKIYKRIGAYTDVVYYGGGIFYAFGFRGYVWAFNLSGSVDQIDGRIVVPANATRGEENGISELARYKRIYLLKTIDESLLLITRTSPQVDVDDTYYITTKFQVYDLDVVRGTWKEINSLGSMAVFLGHSSTTSLDASRFPGVVKANHIYFTEDNWQFYASEDGGLGGGFDSGVYNMETGTVEPVCPGEPLLSKVSPSFWITPEFLMQVYRLPFTHCKRSKSMGDLL